MRRIICEPCAEKRGPKLHPLDEKDGFEIRFVKLLTKKPADHCITLNGERQPQLPSIICDDCGAAIPDGTPAVAVSMWRGGELAEWESEFGEIKT